jgi:hypothetical protein
MLQLISDDTVHLPNKYMFPFVGYFGMCSLIFEEREGSSFHVTYGIMLPALIMSNEYTSQLQSYMRLDQ